jgi:hypothetical protein
LHELLDLHGCDAQPGGALGLLVGDQRARDIVSEWVPFLIGWLGVIRLPSRSSRRPVSRLAWRVREPEFRSTALLASCA